MNTVPPPLPYAARARKRGVSVLLWIGLATLVLGTGPLLAIIIVAGLGLTSDPNPNPIGPGILAFFTFWPGVGLTIAGIVLTVQRRRATRDQTATTARLS